jgi:hypothetical protein
MTEGQAILITLALGSSTGILCVQLRPLIVNAKEANPPNEELPKTVKVTLSVPILNVSARMLAE